MPDLVIHDFSIIIIDIYAPIVAVNQVEYQQD